jgi:predicted secreted acid phosphatase
MTHSYLNKLSSHISEIINQIVPINNYVVVFDIDDTLFDTKQNIPIKPIIDIYLHAKKRGLKTAIITARVGTSENMKLTINQLTSLGITGYKWLYMMPEDKTDITKFKYLSRKNIHDKGYIVLISVGDMDWDIGEFGGVGFKVDH